MKTDQTKKTENGKVPEGYRRTAVGIIPHEWKVSSLDNIGDFLRGKGVSKKDLIEDGLPCVTYGELYTRHHNVIRRFTSFISEKSANDSVRLKQGDILFAGSGETIEEIGKSAAFVDNFKAYAGGDIVILRQKSQDPHFLGYLLNHEVANRQKHKQGQGHSVVHIYPSGLKKIKVPLPPLFEQQKIATILLTWDDAIEKTQKLIDQLKQRNKGLAEQLLTGKKRLKGFRGEWKEYYAGEVFDFLRNTSFSRENLGDGNYYYLHYGDIHVKFRQPILMVADNPRIPKLKYEFEAANNFHVLRNGDLVIADASEDTEGIGDCIEIQNIQNSKIIAGLHTIALRDVTGLTAELFRGYYFKSDIVRNQLRQLATGISVYGISKGNVKEVKLKLPSIHEQQAIAQILEQAEHEITLYEQKLSSLQQQKKGLMQKLLTGEVRVKIE